VASPLIKSRRGSYSHLNGAATKFKSLAWMQEVDSTLKGWSSNLGTSILQREYPINDTTYVPVARRENKSSCDKEAFIGLFQQES
jgi:hypothetical protein